MDTVERLLCTALPSDWFRYGEVHYVCLNGDSAHALVPGHERAIVVAPPKPSLLRSWPSALKEKPPIGVRVLVISSPKKIPYGEIHTRDGMFASAILSTDGDEALGNTIHEWQTTGVIELCPSESTCVFVIKRVPLTSRSFFQRASQWLDAHGFKTHVL